MIFYNSFLADNVIHNGQRDTSVIVPVMSISVIFHNMALYHLVSDPDLYYLTYGNEVLPSTLNKYEVRNVCLSILCISQWLIYTFFIPSSSLLAIYLVHYLIKALRPSDTYIRLVNWPLENKESEISIEIYTFAFKKMPMNISSGKWRPFCVGLNVLNE